MATVAELDEIDIEIQVLENYIPHVRVGDEVRLEITSLPTEILVGRVAEIVPQADLRTRNFPVRVRLKTKSSMDRPLIKAGMFARATLGRRPDGQGGARAQGRDRPRRTDPDGVRRRRARD